MWCILPPSLAVIHFNHGVGTFPHVLQAMGCPVGDCASAPFAKLDVSRMENCQLKCSAAARLSRKRLRRIKKRFQEEFLEEEGPTHGAGQF